MKNKIQIYDLLSRHKDYFILLVSTTYPFSEEELDKYGHLLRWKDIEGYGANHGLSENGNLPWSVNILKKYDQKFDFRVIGYHIIGNKLWNNNLLSEMAKYCDWEALSCNSNIQWTTELIENHKEQWDWKWLSGNNSILWNENLIDNYHKYINWKSLCGNSDVIWSIELINKYKQLIHWGNLSSQGQFSCDDIYKLIDKFSDKINWEELSSNHSKFWTEDFIEKFKEKLNWENLSINSDLPWSVQLFEKYLSRWDMKLLSLIENLPWSVEFFNRYLDKWDFQLLSYNVALPWTKDFLAENSNKFFWYNLPLNSGLPWSEELIDTFIYNWDWTVLSNCIPYNMFSLHFLLKYEDLIDWKYLSRNVLTELSDEDAHDVVIELLDVMNYSFEF